LNLHGWQVTPVVAYKTVSPNSDSADLQESLLHGDADAILFFSPSAVHHFRDLLGAQRFRDLGRQSVFVAIGPVSGTALKAEGVDRVLLPADSTVAAAIATLSEYFAKAGHHQPAGAKHG
jgi:uroporphyrinogen-III synthase